MVTFAFSDFSKLLNVEVPKVFYLSFITFESVAYLRNFPIFPQTFLQIPPCFLSTSWPPFLPFIFYIFISWLFKYNLLGLYNFLNSVFSARDFWKSVCKWKGGKGWTVKELKTPVDISWRVTETPHEGGCAL